MSDSRKRLATVAACLAIGIGGVGFAGCGDDDEEGAAEEAGKVLDEAGEEVGEAAEKAGKKIDKEVDVDVDVGDDAGDKDK